MTTGDGAPTPADAPVTPTGRTKPGIAVGTVAAVLVVLLTVPLWPHALARFVIEVGVLAVCAHWWMLATRVVGAPHLGAALPAGVGTCTWWALVQTGMSPVVAVAAAGVVAGFVAVPVGAVLLRSSPASTALGGLVAGAAAASVVRVVATDTGEVHTVAGLGAGARHGWANAVALGLLVASSVLIPVLRRSRPALAVWAWQDDPEVAAAMQSLLQAVASLDGVVGVISPYDPAGAVQVAPAGPDSGKLAFARISFDPALQQSDFLRLTDEVRTALPTLDGLQIELGGQVFAEFQPPESELLGLAFAVIILLLAFGSVLAMGLPIGVALFGVGTGVALLGLASHLVDMPDFTGLLAVMIGQIGRAHV